MKPCLYCDKPATVGPCIRDGEACNHAITCSHCRRGSVESWNLAIGQTAHDRAYPVDDLPLFRVSA